LLFSTSSSSLSSSFLMQAISHIIPVQVQGAVQRVFNGLFHSRLFMALHLVLEALVFAEFTWEVFGYCKKLEFGTPSLLLPYLLLIVNMVFFILCSRSDPGAITKSNQALFLHSYPYDGVMFETGAECITCKVKKPARSKHCGVCNRCMHRFDHHCIWVNNCIGAFNIKYFLAYLLTLISMAASIAGLTAAFLVQVALLSNLMQGHYADVHGEEHPVDVFFLIQHLFLTFPRIVFMLGSVVFLLIILASYFCFILYLVMTNQTSNEWFKSSRFKHRSYSNIYSRGVWSNMAEIIRPLTSPTRKRK
uniref:Palmitoyltransferase n=1 Tax=Anolis carolinensis TaxID=28377 RepID=A0A803TRR3_ANOCA